jgi:AAA ATPase domain
MDPGSVPLNPFRPGAGQKPLYLAGRTSEQDQFKRLLAQTPVSQNATVTGLRGVGKTVLLEELKPIAQSAGWLWTGNDLSESTSLTEERISTRIVVDLATLLGPLMTLTKSTTGVGFTPTSTTDKKPVDFKDLWKIYESQAGLASDKLKAVVLAVSNLLAGTRIKGVVFAYDEAQNLSDHAAKGEFPLSLLLDVFSSVQRVNTRLQFLLVLSGLPTLFPKLNEARTYTERMFHVMQLEQLNDGDAREAILKPIEITKSDLKFSDSVVDTIRNMSGGYPYFIQYICKEVFDAWIGRMRAGKAPSIPSEEIFSKLDQDFFAPRWARATDRQQAFMHVIATLENSDGEFSVQEIVGASKAALLKGFSPSHATQMLQALAERGLVYKNSRGRYRLAVPLMSRFIQRQSWDPTTLRNPPA